MAILINADGTNREVAPENGTNFKLQEMYRLLGVDMIEIIHLNGGGILVCDEEGKLKNEPAFNAAATAIYQAIHGPVDSIYGNVILCEDGQVR